MNILTMISQIVAFSFLRSYIIGRGCHDYILMRNNIVACVGVTNNKHTLQCIKKTNILKKEMQVLETAKIEANKQSCKIKFWTTKQHSYGAILKHSLVIVHGKVQYLKLQSTNFVYLLRGVFKCNLLAITTQEKEQARNIQI